MTAKLRTSAMLILAVLTMGCGSSKHKTVPKLKTTPVTGLVLVNGEATAGISVECHPDGDKKAINHPVSTMTGLDGKFSLGMYEAGDGLPEGNYKLTFTWETGLTAKDQLNRAYADPAKSKFSVTVTAGTPADVGTIDLKAKK